MGTIITYRNMKTSSNGNISRVTGHLCGEFTGTRWIPHTKASDMWSCDLDTYILIGRLHYKDVIHDPFPVCLLRSISTNHHDDVMWWKKFRIVGFFVWGIRMWPVDSPHNGDLVLLFFFAQISCGTSSRVAGNLRRLNFLNILMGLLPDTQNCECACAGNAGNVFPVTTGKRSRHASRHVRHARALMHAGIAN